MDLLNKRWNIFNNITKLHRRITENDFTNSNIEKSYLKQLTYIQPKTIDGLRYYNPQPIPHISNMSDFEINKLVYNNEREMVNNDLYKSISAPNGETEQLQPSEVQMDIGKQLKFTELLNGIISLQKIFLDKKYESAYSNIITIVEKFNNLLIIYGHNYDEIVRDIIFKNSFNHKLIEIEDLFLKIKNYVIYSLTTASTEWTGPHYTRDTYNPNYIKDIINDCIRLTTIMIDGKAVNPYLTDNLNDGQILLSPLQPSSTPTTRLPPPLTLTPPPPPPPTGTHPPPPPPSSTGTIPPPTIPPPRPPVIDETERARREKEREDERTRKEYERTRKEDDKAELERIINLDFEEFKKIIDGLTGRPADIVDITSKKLKKMIDFIKDNYLKNIRTKQAQTPYPDYGIYTVEPETLQEYKTFIQKYNDEYKKIYKIYEDNIKILKSEGYEVKPELKFLIPNAKTNPRFDLTEYYLQFLDQVILLSTAFKEQNKIKETYNEYITNPPISVVIENLVERIQKYKELHNQVMKEYPKMKKTKIEVPGIKDKITEKINEIEKELNIDKIENLIPPLNVLIEKRLTDNSNVDGDIEDTRTVDDATVAEDIERDTDDDIYTPEQKEKIKKFDNRIKNINKTIRRKRHGRSNKTGEGGLEGLEEAFKLKQRNHEEAVQKIDTEIKRARLTQADLERKYATGTTITKKIFEKQSKTNKEKIEKLTRDKQDLIDKYTISIKKQEDDIDKSHTTIRKLENEKIELQKQKRIYVESIGTVMDVGELLSTYEPEIGTIIHEEPYIKKGLENKKQFLKDSIIDEEESGGDQLETLKYELRTIERFLNEFETNIEYVYKFGGYIKLKNEGTLDDGELDETKRDEIHALIERLPRIQEFFNEMKKRYFDFMPTILNPDDAFIDDGDDELVGEEHKTGEREGEGKPKRKPKKKNNNKLKGSTKRK